MKRLLYNQYSAAQGKGRAIGYHDNNSGLARNVGDRELQYKTTLPGLQLTWVRVKGVLNIKGV